jgi:DNA-binding MarR family transcriptional regulator
VVVTTPAGTSGNNRYTYVTTAVPTVTAITANSGTTAGGRQGSGDQVDKSTLNPQCGPVHMAGINRPRWAGGCMSTGRPIRNRAGDTITRSERAKPRSGGRLDVSPSDPWNAAVERGRKLELAEYPSSLLLRVANVIHQEGTAVYARQHGLALPEWRILGRLCESAPMRLATLCRVSHFDKAQATRVLRTLTARRLVRTFADAAHKHRRIVDITPSGRKLAEAVFPKAIAEQHKLLRALSPQERRVTFNALRKLLAVYGAEIPSPVAAFKDQPS